MLSKITEVYFKETGECAWGNAGYDDESNFNLRLHVEGPTTKYMMWLEDRASKNFKVTKDPTSSNKERNAITLLKKWVATYKDDYRYCDEVYHEAKLLLGRIT
jgi:hypothetical protein